MKLTNNEIRKLENTKSEAEWNATCNEIKRARGGQYPPDWFDRVLVSGLMTMARVQWEMAALNPAGSTS